MTQNTFLRGRGPLAALALGGVLIVLVVVLALWAGSPPPPGGNGPSASPTAALSPSAAPSISASPETTAEPSASTSPVPTTSPAGSPLVSPPASPPVSPPVSPSAGPTTAPATPTSPAATPNPPAGWIEITDFPTYRGGTTVASITTGGPGFVAVGDGGRQVRGRVWTSADGRRWTAQPDAQFAGYFLFNVVRMDGNLFAFGSGARVWRSSDGRDWTALPSSPALQGAGLNDVVVSGRTMIAVGYADDDNGDQEAAAWRSSDGIEWQRVGSPAGLDELWTVAARGSTLVGHGRWPHLSGPLIVYSTDLGDSWQPAVTDLPLEDGHENASIVTLAANDQRFVGVGYRELDSYTPVALTSIDGSNWSSALVPATGGWGLLEQVVTLPDGRFLALGSESGTATARVSSDGANWTSVAPLYTGYFPPPLPEPGDEVVTNRSLAAGRSGVVVAQEWGDGVRVWFGPIDLLD